MRDIFLEPRYALRSLLRSPGYAIASLLTLTLSLTLAIVTLTILDRVLLRPLPFREPDQLRLLLERNRAGDFRLSSYPTFLDLAAQSSAIGTLGYARGTGANLRTGDGLIRVSIANVSRGFFGVLGASAAAGRLFSPDEEEGRGDAVVLSHDLCERVFGGDTSIVGRTIQVNGDAVRVVGVLRAGEGYPTWANLWRPIGAIVDTDPALRTRKLHSDGRLILRLRPGTDSARATIVLSTILGRLAKEHPEDTGWTEAAVPPLSSEIIGDIAPRLRALATAALLIWLLMCANVASLAVARAASRGRELAIRAALGATRARLAAQAFAEVAALALVAGCGGILLSIVVVHLIASVRIRGLPRVEELQLDGRIVGGALALSVFTGLLASAAPALRLVRWRIDDALRHGRAGSADGRASTRLRSVLTVAQMALAVVLLVSAGLLLRSLDRMNRIDLGFDPSYVSTFYVFPPSPTYDRPADAAALYHRLLETVSNVPGVVAAAVVNTPPLTGGAVLTDVDLPRTPDRSHAGTALYTTVSEGYLRTMGMRIVRGRWFTSADMVGGGAGVVVSAGMARRYWPNEEPIGQPLTIYRSSQLRPGYRTPMPSTIVGVVDDVRHFGALEESPDQVYVPYTREVWPGIALVVRTTSDPERAIPALRRAVRQMVPDIPVDDASGTFGFRPLASFARQSLARPRYLAMLVTIFGAAALLLAITGIYGLTAYVVGQRTSEFGIRIALGGTARDILVLVLGSTLRLAAVGGLAGALAALAVGRTIGSVLYGVDATDVATFSGATATLIAGALLASLLPAVRASRLDPVAAIRAE